MEKIITGTTPKTFKMIKTFLVFALAVSLLFSVPLALAQGPTPQIQVTLLNQDPDPVEQGDITDLRFKIENIGGATSESVQMQIIEDYPFTLYTGKAVRDIGPLRAGQTGADAVIIRYTLKVDENAAEGDNEIKVRLRNGEGSWQVYDDKDFFVDVKDYDIPEIQLYLRESTVNMARQKGAITLEVANTDLADVKFLQLSLLPSEDYEMLSTSGYAYIGDVDSDDTETEEFEIYVGKDASGEIVIPVLVKYQDTNEKKYEKNFSLKLRVYDSSDLKRLGLKGNNYFAIAAVVVVVAASVLIYWRSRRKQR